jgi:ankyrin repeat protein
VCVLTNVIVSQYGRTALLYAVDNGHVGIVKMLLQCDKFTAVNTEDEVSDKPLVVCDRIG